MKFINLCFQVHQPYRLRTYRFFNIGQDHQYYDDYQNRHIIRRVAERSYLPANRMMLDMIREFGASFKVTFSISGPVLEQLLQHAPEVIHGFQELAATGCVEFTGETYAHSLASLGSKEEFIRQIEKHRDRINDLFNQRPTTFRNTELIFDDQIGQTVAELGFSTMLTEGAKHVLGWKSPNFLYCSAANPKLKLLLRNFRLSDDIIFRFSARDWSEWPITTEKFVNWLNHVPEKEEVVNLFLNYETLGEQQREETGIFDFFYTLPGAVFSHSTYNFSTPSELSEKLQPVAPVSVLYPISWADEEKDLTAWLGNELQDEAFGKLYGIEKEVMACDKPDVMRDWERLQTSDHFYYMCTKWFSDGEVHKYFNPYDSPYEAFINYMNVLSDFIIRVDEKDEPAKEAKSEKSVAKPKAKVKPKTKGKAKPTTKVAARKPRVKKATTIKPKKKN
ncbi:MAG: polysaccharide deacetylase family protein [Bacteroidales bacterium]|nr:polysaccharide deacetylase family protein [Bacteroidota bacterium]MBL6949423.1 polysaccharide deacetylase family protein [Bacteroidales bacterium]